MIRKLVQLITRSSQASNTRLEGTVSFCDSCSQVCTLECRRSAALDRLDRQRSFRFYEEYKARITYI